MIVDWIGGFFRFLSELVKYTVEAYVLRWFAGFEGAKTSVVYKMYQQRGKYSGVFVHGSVVLIASLGAAFGPSLIVNQGEAPATFSPISGTKIVFANEQNGNVLGDSTDASVQPLTQVSDKPRADSIEYKVESGDTLASISKKFGVSIDTLRWSNDGLKSDKNLKAGKTIVIPPVTGLMYTVKSGETIYSIAKKFNVSAQSIVDFPFNSFTNDETFALAVGQKLVVPDGVMPDEKPMSPESSLARILTPNAGQVSATGSWIWPADGTITQRFKSWHKGVDIANHSAPSILAADSGVVMVAGWPDNVGYGNRVVIDHGNGYKTLYAHMSKISVVAGQSVKRGNVIGVMGSTGRSTGTHLHFEIRTDKGNVDPLSYLK